jgi:hypothetical protein
MAGSKRFVCVAVAALSGLSGPAWSQASSEFVNRCAEWVAKKGYSIDYIEQRTKQRPRGNMAQDWRANLDPREVRAGDVVFVSSGTGSGQRAEAVDEVLRDGAGAITELKVSSMNFGRMVEPSCQITENFGKVTQRTIRFDTVLRAWRPD